MTKMCFTLLIFGMLVGARSQAAVVRTIAFATPERLLTMAVKLPDTEEATELLVERQNFGNRVDLKPGRYSATIASLGKVGHFEIPDGPTKSWFLLVFASRDAPLTIVPIADDTKSIPFGSYHIINAVTGDVGVTFNNKMVVLKPGKSGTFLMPVLPNATDGFPIRMSTMLPGRKKPTQFVAGFWAYESDRRYITLIYQDPQATLPAIQSIPDFKEEAVTPAGVSAE